MNDAMTPAEIREHLADMVEAGRMVAIIIPPDGLLCIEPSITTPAQLAAALTGRELAAWFAAHPLPDRAA